MQGIVQHVVRFVLMCLATGTVQAVDRLYLWEVKGNGASAFLFGSVHLCRADCFPLPAPVLAAFNRSDYLAVELDPGRPGVHEALLKGAVFLEGDSLDRHVPAELVSQLRAVAAQLELPPEPLLRMKPWMAGTALTMLAALRAGYTAENGVDLWFIDRARADGRVLVELETVEQQLDSLGSMAGADQEQILAQALALIRDGSLPAYLDDLLAAWRRGDSDAIYRLSQYGIEDGEAAERVLDAMLSRRNRSMAQRIVSLLDTGRPIFVVVGALHLAGRSSIVELLRARGHEIRQWEGQ